MFTGRRPRAFQFNCCVGMAILGQPRVGRKTCREEDRKKRRRRSLSQRANTPKAFGKSVANTPKAFGKSASQYAEGVR